MKGSASLSVNRSPCGSCLRRPSSERWKSAQSTLPPPSAISTSIGSRFWVAKVRPLAMPCRFRKNDELPCETIFGLRFPSRLLGRFISWLVLGPCVECVKNERPTWTFSHQTGDCIPPDQPGTVSHFCFKQASLFNVGKSPIGPYPTMGSDQVVA